MTESAALTATDAPNVADVQRRTLRLLFVSQIAAGIAIVIGGSVGALLAAYMVGVGVSGLAQSATVVGGALLAVPATRIARRFGRGPSLSAAYLTAAVGAFLVVAAAMTQSVPLLFAGFFLFGGGTTASLQARYAAVDLAPKALYGRHLSIIVWATTLGGVVGPNLAPLAGTSLRGYGVPPLAAPFVVSIVLFALVAVILFVWLRPDPLLVARSSAVGRSAGGAASTTGQAGMGAALRAVVTHRAARLGVAATAVGHVVMVGVMAMTPVHILGAGHEAADTLRIVGIVISVHVAGMYAFAPIMGWLSDRFGKAQVILLGVGLLIGACLVAGTAGHAATRLAVGLVLLGLGWSATMIAGSALLTESMPADLRLSAQGLSDLIMGLAGASSGALSGVVVQAFGYSTLTVVAALMTAPLALLALRAESPLLSRP
ncbi:MAG: MFS transporter [Gemmatimonadaceae bacterium]